MRPVALVLTTLALTLPAGAQAAWQPPERIPAAPSRGLGLGLDGRGRGSPRLDRVSDRRGRGPARRPSPPRGGVRRAHRPSRRSVRTCARSRWRRRRRAARCSRGAPGAQADGELFVMLWRLGGDLRRGSRAHRRRHAAPGAARRLGGARAARAGRLHRARRLGARRVARPRTAGLRVRRASGAPRAGPRVRPWDARHGPLCPRGAPAGRSHRRGMGPRHLAPGAARLRRARHGPPDRRASAPRVSAPPTRPGRRSQRPPTGSSSPGTPCTAR